SFFIYPCWLLCFCENDQASTRQVVLPIPWHLFNFVDFRTLLVKSLTNRPMKANSWHYWTSLLMGVALVPVLRIQHLPLRFDWITLGVAYWFFLAAQSIFVAVMLWLIGLPHKEFLDPFRRRCRQDRFR